jgi:putative phosphoserine phosphatase / 1-acylglycerol-3-phosphate O-acyltransferase
LGAISNWSFPRRFLVTAEPSLAAAAVFDLDRTLINGSAGPVLGRHLRMVGLALPLLDPYSSGCQRLADTLIGPQLARATAWAAKDWPLDLVAKAAEGAADELVERLQPFVPQLLDEHRAAGRRLVLATLTPWPLVAPFASRLGLDSVIAPAWAAFGETYTGDIDGRLPWGRGKVVAVREWARAAGVDRGASFAYSASLCDGPLLADVGHPVAVNPDPPLAALALLERWPVRHLDVAPGVAKVGGRELQAWLRPFSRPELIAYASFQFAGVEQIPRSGPVILVFNHRSYFDPIAMNLLVAKSGRTARFLGKKEVFDVPLLGRLAAAFGGIRVERASGSRGPEVAAAAALGGGEMVVIAPQGTIPRGPAFFDPELKGRWGAARLAAMTGAPVVPVGMWGTEQVWPRSSRLPKLGVRRPRVTVTVGPPVRLAYESPEVDTATIMAAIVDLLPAEARQRRVPTEEQLVRSFPHGYRGDTAKETARRPGTDA